MTNLNNNTQNTNIRDELKDWNVTQNYSVDLETTKLTPENIYRASKVLLDNGIEADEVLTVLQAIGYTLLDTELFPN